MKLLTWNVNGVRAREEQLLALLAEERPDVVCLQEIKVSAEQLTLGLGSLSDYFSYWHGGGPYSGVSLHFHRATFPDALKFEHPAFDRENRFVEAVAGGVRWASVYVPNGGKDYVAKLDFLSAMVEHATLARSRGESLVIAGDLNVTRADIDVYVKDRNNQKIGQREDERELFEKLLRTGLVDIQRERSPADDSIFTWWPYWRGAREKNRGWRIDYVLAGADMAGKVSSCVARRDFGSSDHGPLVVTW